MGGIGVAYKTLDEEDKWADGMYVARGDGGTFAYEMGGIMSALRIAADLANETPGSFSAVTIFTDSAGSLVAIEKGAPGGIVSRNWMRDRAIEQAARLVKMGVRIQLRWVKAHAGDPGNERVDQLAGATARYAALAFGKLAQACADGEVEILPSK